MKISMHAMSVDVFVPLLTQLSHVLKKGLEHASAKNFDPRVLFDARLAPDMFPLSRQVQIACDMARKSAARLAGREPESWEDNEQSIEELRARIDRTIDYLRSLPAEAFEGSEERQIDLPLRDRTLRFRGLQLLQRWALPNVLFHVVTAYDILRHNGVDIGKQDFLGDLPAEVISQK